VKKITLTFDNGPTPGVTDKVLDILAKRNVDATFMVVGQNLLDPSATALLDDVSAAGHWIGNHSLTHTVAFGERRDAAPAGRPRALEALFPAIWEQRFARSAFAVRSGVELPAAQSVHNRVVEQRAPRLGRPDRLGRTLPDGRRPAGLDGGCASRHH